MAHPDANIIFGQVIDDAMGDEVRVTVIAAGFDNSSPTPLARSGALGLDDGDGEMEGFQEEEGLARDDDFDVPDFLK